MEHRTRPSRHRLHRTGLVAATLIASGGLAVAVAAPAAARPAATAAASSSSGLLPWPGCLPLQPPATCSPVPPWL